MSMICEKVTSGGKQSGPSEGTQSMASLSWTYSELSGHVTTYIIVLNQYWFNLCSVNAISFQDIIMGFVLRCVATDPNWI